MSCSPLLVLVTASSIDEARRSARGILDQHLAACVNIVPGVESHYWWQDKLESTSEAMLVIKSSEEQFEVLSDLVRSLHSYVCPEIVAIPPGKMDAAYRTWWEAEMTMDRAT